MKNLFILLLICASFIASAQCTYDTPDPFPTNLTVESGEVLCISSDLVTPNTSLTVRDGGLIRIYNNSTFRVNGSMSVEAGGYVDFEDCNSALEINGTYNGGWNTCELRRFCGDCDTASNPFTLIWGNKIWDEYCCYGALPVELIEFTVKPTNDRKSGLITWTTASEINNDYFIIQRSIDAKNWSNVDTVNGSGTTSTLTSYAYRDDRAIIGTSYYRLFQVDYDGTSDISEIKSLSIEGDFYLFPNPSNGTNINIYYPKSSDLLVQVYDITGCLIVQMQSSTYSTSDSVKGVGLTINTNLASGIYQVLVKTEEATITKRLIVRK